MQLLLWAGSDCSCTNRQPGSQAQNTAGAEPHNVPAHVANNERPDHGLSDGILLLSNGYASLESSHPVSSGCS